VRDLVANEGLELLLNIRKSGLPQTRSAHGAGVFAALLSALPELQPDLKTLHMVVAPTLHPTECQRLVEQKLKEVERI